MTWRQIDDQALDFATPDRVQLARDQLNMWRELERLARVQFIKTALNEAREVLPQDQKQLLRSDRGVGDIAALSLIRLPRCDQVGR